MTARIVSAALTLVVLTVSAGCGDPNPGTVGSDRTTSGSSPGAATTSTSDSKAITVSLLRTGGLRPSETQLVYHEGSPPPTGTSPSERDAILQAASDPTLRHLSLIPVPKNACCDVREYTVTITYADGSSQSFQTLDGLQQPKVFENLLSMLG